MATTRRVTFRLYPNKTQTKKLHNWRRLHCYLYNAALSNRRTQYQKFHHKVDYFEQQNCLPAFKQVWPEFKELGSHALQATLKRVDFAYQRFFKGLGKYPRFKAIRRYRGWTYPCKAGWKVLSDGKHGRLRISNIKGDIRMRGQARTWGTPTTCTILLKDGKWYASITGKCEPQRQTGNRAIGIDFGVNAAASLSDGTQIPNPRFLKAALKKAKKGSKRRRQKMGLNRSVLDVGIGMLTSFIAYKLDEAGGVLVMVPTVKVKPSQTCPECGHQQKKTLSLRIHQCLECGFTEDRDVAAAKVILHWALGTSVIKRGETSSTATTKERKNCGSMRQLGSARCDSSCEA